MPLQKRIAFVGLARQTGGKGVGIATPVFGLGVRGGSMLSIGLEQESDAITYGTRISADENRTGINPGITFPTRLYPRSGGLLLYSALGTLGTAGPTGGNYTHTITPGATLPYLTGFSQLDTEYHKIVDLKCDELKIAWDGRGPWDVDATFMGVTWTGYTSSWTPTNDETGQLRAIGPGGVFQLHGRTSTPVDAAIRAGEITISNNLEPIDLSKSVAPDDIFEAEQVITVSFTLKPANTTEFRRAIGDADAATAAVGYPVYGSFLVTANIDANTFVTLTGTRVAFTPEYPEADPGGGAAELVMTGRVKKPAGTAFTATIQNQTASY